LTEKVTQADLDKANKMVCDQYAQHRAAGGTASSPYAYFLVVQASNRRTLQRLGRGDFELWELSIVRDDGTSTIVDLRNLAPDVFGDPDDSKS
jgi:hypothetical protein